MSGDMRLPWGSSNGALVRLNDADNRVVCGVHRIGKHRGMVESANSHADAVARAAFIRRAVNSHDDLIAALEAIEARYIAVCLTFGHEAPGDDEAVIAARAAIRRARG